MGKLRKKRKKARIQPTGLPSVAEAIEEQESVLDAVDSSSAHDHLIEMVTAIAVAAFALSISYAFSALQSFGRRSSVCVRRTRESRS